MLKRRIIAVAAFICAFIVIVGSGYSIWCFDRLSNSISDAVELNVCVAGCKNAYGEFIVGQSSYSIALEQGATAGDGISFYDGESPVQNVEVGWKWQDGNAHDIQFYVNVYISDYLNRYLTLDDFALGAMSERTYDKCTAYCRRIELNDNKLVCNLADNLQYWTAEEAAGNADVALADMKFTKPSNFTEYKRMFYLLQAGSQSGQSIDGGITLGELDAAAEEYYGVYGGAGGKVAAGNLIYIEFVAVNTAE